MYYGKPKKISVNIDASHAEQFHAVVYRIIKYY